MLPQQKALAAGEIFGSCKVSPEAAPRGGLGRTCPPQYFSGPIFQFVEIQEEIFRGGGTMVAHEKNDKKDHFVSDLLLKVLQFYPGLL